MFSAGTARIAQCDDPPPTADGSPEQSFDPADVNHDGIVSPGEARRYRRKMRRARRQPTSKKSTDDPQTISAPADDKSADVSAGGASAGVMVHANAAAQALKNSLPSADAGAMAEAGAGAGPNGATTIQGARVLTEKSPGGHAGGVSGAGGNISDPHSMQDFALAAKSGYAPAFTAAGLKMSADGHTVLRLDGTPATSDDLERLRKGILAMPGALVRRADFFSAISPEHYSGVKEGYHSHPELSDTVYKHVGTTQDDRDMVHTASCAKMSGECNENIKKASYHKGDFVAPEDLDRMYDALQKDLDGQGDETSQEIKSSFPNRAGSVDSESPPGEVTGPVSKNGQARSSEGTSTAGPGSSAHVQAAMARAKGLITLTVSGLWAATSRARGSAVSRILILGAALCGVGLFFFWQSQR
jgi:hypothetical protein